MGDDSNVMWTEINENSGETGWTIGEEEADYFEDMNWEPTPIDAAPGLEFLGEMVLMGRLSEDHFGGYCIHVVQYI
jgi:hypothetical protein